MTTSTAVSRPRTHPGPGSPAAPPGTTTSAAPGPTAVPQASYDLLALAVRGLAAASSATTPGERYASAHLAALRAAAAVPGWVRSRSRRISRNIFPATP